MADERLMHSILSLFADGRRVYGRRQQRLLTPSIERKSEKLRRLREVTKVSGADG